MKGVGKKREGGRGMVGGRRARRGEGEGGGGRESESRG